MLNLDNAAADASAAPELARDAASIARSRSWLTCSRVATFGGRPTEVVVRYFDADSYHAALAAIGALDAEERRLRAQLREMAADASRTALVQRLREIPRERAAHARQTAPAAEVAVAVIKAGGGEFATGPCTCRHARAGRSCEHPRLAELALDAWLRRGQRHDAPAVFATTGDGGSVAETPGRGAPERDAYVDPGICAEDLQPVRHLLPVWCYTPQGVRRPLAEVLELWETVVLPLERELARRGVAPGGLPCSAEALRRAYGAPWEPVSWVPAADDQPETVAAAAVDQLQRSRTPRALERQILQALQDSPRSFRELCAAIPAPGGEGETARTVSTLLAFGLVEPRDGRYHAVAAAAEASA